jgi:Uncharacterized protein family UPF0004/Radical SAM superfamily
MSDRRMSEWSIPQPAMLPKRLFIKTYGCQMNVYDSARMADLMAPLGYTAAASAEGADLVILNTCHIRAKAAEKVFSELGGIRRLKHRREREGQRMVVAVAGCVAQAEGEEIRRRAPFVDIVFGPQAYHRLPDMVARALAGGGVLDTSFPAEPKFDYLPESQAAPGASAFLTVQEGCDKFCTFCVVPYTRGAEYSRSAADIIAEARRLVAAGAREITLLGQNVNAYHGAGSANGANGGDWGLGQLIRGLAELPGLERIRYTTSHPRDIDASLIAAHREVPQLMPFLHLPPTSTNAPSSACAQRGRILRCLPISLSATRARARTIFGRRSISSPGSASRRLSRSNIRRGPERRLPKPTIRCRNRSRPSGLPRCRICCNSSSARSITPVSVRSCRSCSRNPAAIPISWSGAALTCKPSMRQRRRIASAK